MSQQGKARKRRKSDEGDEEVFENGTQASDDSASQVAKKRKAKDTLQDVQERDKLVADLMRYVLFSDFKRTPVTKAKIAEKVLSEHRGASGLVIAEAKRRFVDLFGFDLVELPTKLSSKKAGAGSSGVFVLKNILEKKDALRWTPSEKNTSALLMMVLTIIYLQPAKAIDEESLFDELKRLGFERGKEHETCGAWDKELAALVSEQYLDRKTGEKLASGSQKKLADYKIGPRSIVEIGTRKIVTYLSNVYGLDEPDEKLLQQLELDEQNEALLEEDGVEQSQVPASRPPASQAASQVAALPRASQVVADRGEDFVEMPAPTGSRQRCRR